MKTARFFQKLTYFFAALGIVFAGAGFWNLDLSPTNAESPELGLSITGSSPDPGEAIIMVTVSNSSIETKRIRTPKVSLSPNLKYVTGTTVGLTRNEPVLTQEGDWTALNWRDSFTIPPGNSTLGFKVIPTSQNTSGKAVITAQGDSGALSPATTTFTIRSRAPSEAPSFPSVQAVEVPPVLLQASPAATVSPVTINVTQEQRQEQGMGQGSGQQQGQGTGQEQGVGQGQGQGQGQEANPSADVTTPAPVVVTPAPVVITPAPRAEPPPVVVAPQPTPQPVVTPQPAPKEVKEVKVAEEVKKEVKVEACAGDETITFEPPDPKEGEEVLIKVSSKQPSVNVRLEAPGPPGTPEPVFLGVEEHGKADPIWSWKISNLLPGKIVVKFFINDNLLCATNTLEVAPKPKPPAPVVTPPEEFKPPLPITGGWNIRPFNFLAFFSSLASFGTAFILYFKAKQYTLPIWQRIGYPSRKKWYYY